MHRRSFLTNTLLPLAAVAASESLSAAASSSAASSAGANPSVPVSIAPGKASGLSFPARERMALSGEWEFEPLARTEIQPDELIHEDRASLPAAGRMQVPSNWHLAGLAGFHGRVAYRRKFTVSKELAGKALWLCFGGVDYFARIRLNGQPLGEHEGYFEPFEIEVTGLLKAGENLLEVVVDAPRENPSIWPNHKRQIKGIFNQWLPVDRQMEPTGGIVGDLYLEQRTGVQIRSVRYSSKVVPSIPAGNYALAGAAPTDYPQTGRRALVTVEVEFWLRDAGAAHLDLSLGPARWQGSVSGQSGLNHHTAILAVDDPKLWFTWDFGEPFLYDAKVSLARPSTSDLCEFKAGIREIQFDPAHGEWRLNGERFFVRGSSVIPDKWLAHYTNSQIAKDIDLLRSAHINGVRVCVHVTRDEFYAACDRAGILVWQDFPLQWQYTHDTQFLTEASQQLQAMIRHLYNHPCIGLWTCQNEPDPPNRLGMDPTLAATAQRTDSSRFVYEACEYTQHPYPGWYYGEMRDFETQPIAPVISEFGAQGLLSPGEMRQMLGDSVWPPNEKWIDNGFETRSTFVVAGISRGRNLDEFIANSQRYQARLIQFSVEQYRRAKYTKLGGFFHFMFMDGWPTIGWSVLSYNRIPKAGFQALQRAMQPILPMVKLLANRLATRPKETWPTLMWAWLVNDTRNALEKCRVAFALRGSGRDILLQEITTDVAADSVQQLNVSLPLPTNGSGFAPGDCNLVVSAYSSSGTLLGENLYELTFVDVEGLMAGA